MIKALRAALGLLILAAPSLAHALVMSDAPGLRGSKTYAVCKFNTRNRFGPPFVPGTRIPLDSSNPRLRLGTRDDTFWPSFEMMNNDTSSFYVAAQCASDPGGVWESQSIQLQLTNTYTGHCATGPLTTTVTAIGAMRIGDGVSWGPQIPIRLVVELRRIGNLGIVTTASLLGNAHDSGAQGWDAIESQTSLDRDIVPLIKRRVAGRVVPYDTVVRGLSTDVCGAHVLPTPPSYNTTIELHLSGTISAPEPLDANVASASAFGADVNAGVDTGLDADSNQGEFVDEVQALEVFDALASLTEIGVIPRLSSLIPLPAYMIEVRYRTALGSINTIKVPAVLGVPSPVVLPGAPVGSDKLLVTLGNESSGAIGNFTRDDQSYELRVRRLRDSIPLTSGVWGLLSSLPSPSCSTATPIDIAAIMNLDRPELGTLNLARSVKTLSIGYKSLSKGATDSPKDFRLVYRKEDGGFSVHQHTAPCSEAQPLLTQARYSDQNTIATDLNLAIDMPAAPQQLEIASFEDDQNKRIVHYKASAPIRSIELYGVSEGAPIHLGISNLPENIEFCSHSSGNRCNMPWRAGKNSERSISFISWDALGNQQPTHFYLYSATTVGGNVTQANFSLSNLAMDMKIGMTKTDIVRTFSPTLHQTARLLGRGRGGFPYWVYLDTRGTPVIGRISTKAVTFNAPSTGVSSWNREVSLRSKWYGVRLYRRGSINCGDLELRLENGGSAGSWLARKLACG